MNEVFLTLPKEKQQRIINAGLEVFSRHDYKKASTDVMASNAGISKGSLFYYFKNKKSYYLYLFDYVYYLVIDFVLDTNFDDITDFYELIYYAANQKMTLVNQYPYLLDFLMKAYLSNKEDISDELQETIITLSSKTYSQHFKNVDFNKFKDGVDPEEIYNMLQYATEGYIHKLRKMYQPFCVDALMEECRKWITMFKKLTYKGEYQDENNGY